MIIDSKKNAIAYKQYFQYQKFNLSWINDNDLHSLLPGDQDTQNQDTLKLNYSIQVAWINIMLPCDCRMLSIKHYMRGYRTNYNNNKAVYPNQSRVRQL
jgi:hypothetical protein